MRKIPLTQGKVAVVDDEDYKWLKQWRWYAARSCNDVFYAQRSVNINGKIKSIKMHQLILGKKKGFEIDHVDGDGLNNQRHNLRHVTKWQNRQNRHHKRTSKYPGVSWHKGAKKWRAQVRRNGKSYYLGIFINEEEAFLTYCEAVKELGEEILTDWGASNG